MFNYTTQWIHQTIGPLVTAIIVCLIFAKIGIPVAWLIGSLIAGIGYALVAGTPIKPPPILLTIGKAIIGIVAAARFSPDNLMIVATYILPLVLALGITGSLSMLNGYLIARWSGIKLITCLLGAIPGTASANVAISSEFGAEPPIVAVLQYLRVLLVVLIVPTVAGIIAGLIVPESQVLAEVNIANTSAPISTVSMIWNLVILGLCCILGIWTGNTFNLPTQGFLGSFLWGLFLFGFFPDEYRVPRPLILLALLFIGLSAGLKFNWQHIVVLRRALILEIVLVLLLISGCIGIGYGIHSITNIGLVTAILAFAPGGMEAMIATSNQLGGDTGIVLTIKFINQLLIIFSVNYLRSFLQYYKTREK